jgi:hypothetical protein
MGASESNHIETATGPATAAMPADVRKAFGLPASLPSGFWAMPNLLRRSPEFIISLNGSAERFRPSGGGIAVSRESLSRQSHY